MVPAQKKVIRTQSDVRSKRKEDVPRRKLTRRRATKRRGQSVERRVKRRRHNYNLRSDSAVEFVSETPCCLNEDTRRKYARLALDSALFHCRARPARRKQSHISVVTVSSSDDEESMARTAEWVASVANKNIPCPEDLYQSDSNNRACGEPEEIQQHLSPSQLPITQSISKTFEYSTSSSASTTGKYPRSTYPQSVEGGPPGFSTSDKYPGCADSVMSGSFHSRSSEIHQSPTLRDHRECFPLCAKIPQTATTSKNVGKISIFGPTLPSIQEFTSISPSNVDKQIPTTHLEVQRPFSFVTPSQNPITIGSDERRPFCTITPESHATPFGSEVKRHFYSRLPETHHSSSSEERNQFYLITPTKEQVSQEYRPLCSSTPESYQSISRFSNDKHNMFCNINPEKKQESKLMNPQVNISCLSSNLEPIKVQDSPEVALETLTNTKHSLIFQNPINSSLITSNTHRNLFSIADLSVQKDRNELLTENNKQFYFGSLKVQDPSEHSIPSEVEESTLANNNNSMSSYECSISGIERISLENPESPQSLMTQESMQRLESSKTSDNGSVI